MKKFFKVLVAIVGSILVLLIVAVVLVSIFVNPNDYKGLISKEVKAQTGRELTFDGDISLTFFPWLGVQLGPLSLSNAPGFGEKPFVKIEGAKISARILPLFLLKLEMDTIYLNGLTLNLERDAAGKTNWADLTKTKPEEGKKQAEKPSGQEIPLRDLYIGGVQIKNALVVWDDKKDNVHYALKKIDLKTGRIQLDKPIVFDLSFIAESAKDALAISPRLKGTAFLDLGHNVYSIDNLRLITIARGNKLPGKEIEAALSANVKADLNNQTFDMDNMAIEAMDLKAKGTLAAKNIFKEVEFSGNLNLEQFSIRDLMKKLGQTVPDTADKSVLTKTTASLAFSGTPSMFNLKDMVVHLDDSRIRGEAVVKDFQNPSLHLALNLDKISLDRYLPPRESTKDPKQEVKKASGYTLKDLNLVVDRKNPAQPVDFKLAFNAESKEPVFMVSSKMAGAANVDLPGKVYQIDNLKISATANSDKLPGKQVETTLGANVKADLNQQTLNVSNLLLEIYNLKAKGTITANNIFKEPDFAGNLIVEPFNPKALAARLGQKLPETADKTALEKASADITFSGGPQSMDIQNLLVTLDQTNVKGRASVKDFKNPAISLSLTLDAISPERYLPPGTQQGTEKGRQFSFKNVSVALDRKEPSAPIVFDVSFDASRKTPPLDVSPRLAGTLNIDQANEVYKVDGLALTAAFRGENLPKEGAEAKMTTNINADLKNQTLDISGLKLAGLGLNANGGLKANHILESPAFSGDIAVDPFSLRKLLHTLGQTPPDTADKTTLEKVSARLSFSGTGESFETQDLAFVLDDTTIKGRAAAANLKAPAPRYTFSLTADQMDLDRYLPPPSEEKAPKKEKVPQPKGKGEGSKPDLKPLRTLNCKGDVTIGKLTVKKVHATDVKIDISAKDGVIAIDPILANLYQGTAKAKVTLDAKTDEPAYRFENSIDNLEAGPFLKDMTGKERITGLSMMKASLTAKGADPEMVKKSLNGNISFSFKDGAIKGVNIAKMIRDAFAVLKGQAPSGNEPVQTDFAELSGSAAIANGIAKSDDLLLKSPLLRVHGKGATDLINDQIDYLLSAAVVGTLKGQGGESLDKLTNIPIPIRVSGPLADPKYALDTKALGTALAKETLKQPAQQLEESLKKKFLGGGTTTEQKATSTPSTTKSPTTTPAPAPEKPEDLLKKVLPGLNPFKK